MKNIAFALFAVLISITLKSQSSIYHPFPTANAHWIYQFIDEQGNYTNLYRNYRTYGDTTIGAKVYKQLYLEDDYIGGYRDSGKRIYWLADTAKTEYALYDFSLNLNDTFYNKTGIGKDTLIVKHIDSTEALDGYRKSIHLSGCPRWIEGIGNEGDFFDHFALCMVSGFWKLICFTSQNTLIYPKFNSNCTVAIPWQPRLAKKFAIYPNPFHTTAILKIEDYKYSDIYIYNSQGMLIRKEKTTEQSSFLFERGTLPDGIYFIKAVNKKGQTRSSKMIIE